MVENIPHDINELLECQVELVKHAMGDIPIYHETMRAIIEAAQTDRLVHMKDTVRESTVSMLDPSSYDKGYEACINFITELTRKEE